MGYVWFVTQVLTQAQEMVTPARGCSSSIQHHQCSKPLKSSQEICTRAFLLCLQQRLKESSFSKCSFYELQGFSPDQVGRTPAESCLNNFLCTTKDKSSSHQGLDRCGSHSSQLDQLHQLGPVQCAQGNSLCSELEPTKVEAIHTLPTRTFL